MTDDLASGFQNVDKSDNFAMYAECLTLLDSILFFSEYKRESYDLLRPTAGLRVLEVGCGLGDDAAALAGLVAPPGTVVGVDGSRAMVEAARKRHEGIEGLSFKVADAAALPFNAATFDGCRTDRVLQHIGDPAAVVREMARVLRPGGALVAYDNDWETLTVSSTERALTRVVLNTWCDRFPSGWIGRQLVPLLVEAGLQDVAVFPKTLVLRELDLADKLYCFFTTAQRLVDDKVLGPDQARRWTEGLREMDRSGRFFCSYTGFLVHGTKGLS
jgi:ubiquinone/menaquinone biosynthesis C-methylase UbiE